ncbi:TrkA family potassium uptake protein [Haloechinothrix sp. LS1_15]|uniref:potassium channel family protein n=1 Tax=Haloechinothrix sp. LS1_15 TaxID=2652248 RepID=UPI0029462E38|nr:TrkA family potassium uptake protein [Haloechinothrix sp. LS1_15]MDV6014454.1 TrkA family potassium uptake protein [Haloechinothrix sp. LS1_15]
MHVVIMGCGRVGASLANALERLGHDVAVIDKDLDAFRRLGAEFHGDQILGIGFNKQTLREAGIDRAEAFAAVSSGDNSNIISARVARETFGVTHVVARIYDHKRAAVYERLGIPTVATVPWTTDRFLHTLVGDSAAPVWRDPSGQVALLHLRPSLQWVGATFAELERTTGARVAFLRRAAATIYPEGDERLAEGDSVYVVAGSDELDTVERFAGTGPPAHSGEEVR